MHFVLLLQYLDSLKTYSDKDRVSTEVLLFLCHIAKGKESVSLAAKGKESVSMAAIIRRASETDDLESYSKVVQDNEMESDARNINENIEKDSLAIVNCDTDMTDPEERHSQKSDTKQNSFTNSFTDKLKSDTEQNSFTDKQKENERKLNELGASNAAVDTAGKNGGNYEQKRVSHQTLEMLLYKTCLNLQTGRIKTALRLLQVGLFDWWT